MGTETDEWNGTRKKEAKRHDKERSRNGRSVKEIIELKKKDEGKEILKMKQNKKIFLPWYKKKNRGRDKWNRFENRKKRKCTHTREQKQNIHAVVTRERENRKEDIKPTIQMSEIDAQSVYIIG